MKSFRTEIVETKDLITVTKLVATGFLLSASYLWVISAFSKQPVLKFVFGIFCFTGVVLFLTVPFLKPKKIGRLQIDPEGIDFSYLESGVRITLPQIKQLDLRYGGFKRWRNHAAHGNRNYLILKTIGDDYFEFEILVKSSQDKKILADVLAAQKDNSSVASFVCEKEVHGE